ncbi:CHAT domain-containing protein [Sphingomonas sp. Sphisp140]|uniref:CHAT domain-containing protein n=1 Tax=unclassified Sphingomonas TaxID=196159 RepID=UPI0039AF43D9
MRGIVVRIAISAAILSGFAHAAPNPSAPRQVETTHLSECPAALDKLIEGLRLEEGILTRTYGAGRRDLPLDSAEKAARILHAALGTETGGSAACGEAKIAIAQASAHRILDMMPRGGRPGDAIVQDLGRAVALLGQPGQPCGNTTTCALSARIAFALPRERPPSGGEAICADRRGRDCAWMLARRAIAYASSTGPSLAGAEAWMALAEIDGKGDHLDATAVLRAYAELSALGNLPGGKNSLAQLIPNAFRHRLLPIFQAAADTAYESGSKGSTLLLEIGEASRRAQIEDSVADACDRLAVPLSYRDLLAGERIIYPVVGTARSYILVAGNDSAQRGWSVIAGGSASGGAQLAAAASALVAALQPASASVSGGADPDTVDWEARKAQFLYAQLIAPLIEEKAIPAPTATSAANPVTLIFFPDPILRNVPWALLHPESDPQAFLLRAARIAIGPGLAYVRAPATIKRGGVLLGGFDAYGNERLEQFLTGLDASQSDGRTRALIGRDAFKPSVLGQALERDRWQIVLLATHAQWNRAGSYIVVPSEDKRTQPCPPPNDTLACLEIGKLEASLRKGERRATSLELLIFIACDAAASDAGDIGIAGAALRGGARTTVGPLVSVQRGPTPEYFSRNPATGQSFLNALLNEGETPAGALRLAQLDNEGELGFPPTWGVFVVVGNWR